MKISKLAVLINGKDLPVAFLSESFQREPGVVRDSKRKRLLYPGDCDAAYCFFDFPAADTICDTLGDFFGQNYEIMVRIAGEECIREVRLHIPLYLSHAYNEVISASLLQTILDVNSSVWLDCYFDAPDVIPPPENVTAGNSTDVDWFGGGMDYVSWSLVGDGETFPLNPCDETVPSRIAAQLLETKEKAVGKDQGCHICLRLESLRANRSLEIKGELLQGLCEARLPLEIQVTHSSW